MATLENLMGILDTMGSAQIATILALVAMVLILLIYFAFRQRESEDKVRVAPTLQYGRNSGFEPVASQTDNKQAGDRGHEPVARQEEEPEPSPVAADSARTAAERRLGLKGESEFLVEEKSAIPQDSILRRHYLANEAAKQAALHNPYPSDSILKRHYDSLHKPVVAQATTVKTSAEAAAPVSRQKASIIEQAINKDQTVAIQSAPALSAKISVPQDSVLRRHFICQLRAEIEAGLSPRPSDSVLRRHYDNLVGIELEKRLAG